MNRWERQRPKIVLTSVAYKKLQVSSCPSVKRYGQGLVTKICTFSSLQLWRWLDSQAAWKRGKPWQCRGSKNETSRTRRNARHTFSGWEQRMMFYVATVNKWWLLERTQWITTPRKEEHRTKKKLVQSKLVTISHVWHEFAISVLPYKCPPVMLLAAVGQSFSFSSLYQSSLYQGLNVLRTDTTELCFPCGQYALPKISKRYSLRRLECTSGGQGGLGIFKKKLYMYTGSTKHRHQWEHISRNTGVWMARERCKTWSMKRSVRKRATNDVHWLRMSSSMRDRR